MLENLNLGES